MSEPSEQQSKTLSPEIASVAGNLQSLTLGYNLSDRSDSADLYRSKDIYRGSIATPNPLHVRAMLRELIAGGLSMVLIDLPSNVFIISWIGVVADTYLEVTSRFSGKRQ